MRLHRNNAAEWAMVAALMPIALAARMLEWIRHTFDRGDPMSYADRQPDMTIDYGRADPAARRWWNYTRADVQARVDGVLEFLGMVLAMVGGGRRVAFALALMLLAGGLGDCLGAATEGPKFMALGGGILGFLLPLPKR